MPKKIEKTDWKNRIVGHGSKPASQFQAHPNNWRKHPDRQRRAVRGSLDDLGWIDTVIENVRTGHLIDGHERVWQALDNSDAEVPYIQVDLSESEEAQALLSLDSIAALAETDAEKVDALLREVHTSNAEVMEFLEDMANDAGLEKGKIKNEQLHANYKNHHVLLSFPIDKIDIVQRAIQILLTEDWMEVEQSTN